ncbi:Calx-beta domain-containing protein [Sediminicola sp. 1XM1-17]|uniref:Calx-beta domain-containing protein n=1 Tax=Sediminicola sp. 1XM1-17 TaxID=3127702 RepID=UPI003076ED16
MILENLYTYYLKSIKNNSLSRIVLVGVFLIFGLHGYGQVPTVSIIQNGNGQEAGPTPTSFTVSVAPGAAVDGSVDVFYAVLGSSTATAGDDYTALSGSITVGYTVAGGGSEDILVTVLDDVLVEGNETIVVELSADPSYTVAASPNNTATVTIEDNDSYIASINATDDASSEAGADPGTFTISLNTPNATGSPIVVNYTIDGSAGNTADYATIGTSVSIANGASTGTVTITPVDDALVEGNETVILTLASGTGYVVAASPNNTDTVNITDNDTYTASIAATDDTATEESSTTGIFTVSLNTPNATGSPIVVNYSIDGSAGNTADYATIGTSVSIANGASSGTVTITPVDDALVEGNETVVLTLASGTGYVVAASPNNTDTVNITDNDSYTASIAATDDTATEASSTTGIFTVSLNTPNATGSPIVVNYSIGGSAGNTADYATIGTSVSIANGASSGTVTITPVDDALVEGNETVVLTLASGTGYVVAASPNNTDTVNITDNDSYIASINATDDASSEAGADPGTFTINLNTPNATGSPIVVNYSIGGSAGNTADYATIGTSVSIANGASTGTVTITPVDDALVEGNETVILTLASGTGYVVAASPNNTDTVNITDNDTYTASIVATDDTATEASSTTGTFTVSLSTANTTGVPIIVNYSISGSATNTTDYGTLSGSVSIPNAASSAVVVISPVNDVLVEGAEIVTLTLAAGSGYAVAASPNNTATVTIEDNDNYIATISATDATASEAGPTTGTFTISLNTTNISGSPITVNYNVSGSADSGTDFNALSGSVTIPNGAQTSTVTLNPLDDSLVEGTESVTLTIVAGTGYTIGASSNSTVNISDNDTASIAINSATVTVNEAAGSVSFIVTLTGNVPSGFTVDYATSDQSASAGSDYTETNGTLNFTGTNGQNRTITVPILNDIFVEPSETFIVTLSNVNGSGTINITNNTGTASIVDNDSANLTIGDVVVNENTGPAIFTVTLTGNAAGSFTVDYATSNGSAIAGQDYAATSGTLNFTGASGESRTISVPINNDGAVEQDEDFTVTLSNVSNILVFLGDATGIGTIVDDEVCPAGNTAPPLDPAVDTIFCDSINQDLNEYVNNIPSGLTLVWSRVSDPYNVSGRLNNTVVTIAATYFGFYYDSANDCYSPAATLELELNFSPEISVEDPEPICEGGTVDLNVTVSEEATIRWFDSETGTTILAEGATFSPNVSSTTVFYVEASANDCTSARVPVTVTVFEQPNAGTATDIGSCSVAAGGPTTLDLDDTLTGADPGTWTIDTDPSGSLVIGANNIVDFEGLANGDYVFTYTTTGAEAPCSNESVSVTVTVVSCTVDSDNDGLLDGTENTLGTDPNNPDSDGDGIEDGVEVGDDTANPLDEDGDGIIDALDSNSMDSDSDGVVDQLDPANDDACIPNISAACRIDLQLEKTVDNASPTEGRQVIFTVTLTNLSQITVANVVINELIDSSLGFQYVSHVASNGIYDEVAGRWELMSVAPEEVSTLTITVTVPREGTFQNIASLVSSSPEDGNTANNVGTATVEVAPRSSDEPGFIFNQFSPNGDGINDILIINDIETYPNNTLEIYDRYGNQVLSITGYDNSWTGEGDNGELPKGTYFYILDLGEGSEVRKGWIQIIR